MSETRANGRDGENLRLDRRRYAGLTRGQPEVRARALYDRLRRAGLLSHVPLKQHRRVIPDPLAFFGKVGYSGGASFNTGRSPHCSRSALSTTGSPTRSKKVGSSGPPAALTMRW